MGSDSPEVSPEVPVPGVGAIEHTADVGLEVEAPDAGELFLRAARGMAFLILEGPPPSPSERRSLSASASDLAALLRAWLRELLYWHESEGLSFVDASFERLDEERLIARVDLGPDPAEPVREIKGVTFHGLVAEKRDGGWFARVIFDV